MGKVRDFRLPSLPIVQWVMLALVLIAFTMVIYEVQDLKRQIRQANYLAVMSNLKAALIERWVETQLFPKSKPQLVGANAVIEYRATLFNPMRLLKQVPENYLGALNKAPNNAKDVWFFNSKQNCLVYVNASGKPIPHPLVTGSLTRGMIGGLDIAPNTGNNVMQ